MPLPDTTTPAVRVSRFTAADKMPHATTCPTCHGSGRITRSLRGRPALRAIIDAVSTVTEIPAPKITSARKTIDLVRARDMVAHLGWCAGYSSRQIGHTLGGRDPSTIVESRHRAAHAMKRDALFAGDVRWADEIARGGAAERVAAE